MLFKQLFENESSTYTYLISCQDKQEAILIDPVLETLQRDLKIIEDMNLKLIYAVDTHIHADHITSASALREITNCKIAGPENDNLKCRDINLKDEDFLLIGNNLKLEAIYTPGHTNTHFSYVLKNKFEDFLFTGDSLLIDSCGRTDFQSGSSEDLYNTIKNKFYTMPDDTKIFPAHDYNKKNSSTIYEQKKCNALINDKVDIKDFKEAMKNLKLDKPKKIDIAVPHNNKCGVMD